jgi:hypothetical protein
MNPSRRFALCSRLYGVCFSNVRLAPTHALGSTPIEFDDCTANEN